MDLGELTRRARAVADNSSDTWPAEAIQVGDLLEQALGDSEILRSVATKVVALAEQLGCERLLGASPVGDRLAGASVVLASNGLSLLGNGDTAQHVLIIDGTLASGMQLARACESARVNGARRASAVVVFNLDPAQAVAGLESLSVLEPS